MGRGRDRGGGVSVLPGSKSYIVLQDSRDDFYSSASRTLLRFRPSQVHMNRNTSVLVWGVWDGGFYIQSAYGGDMVLRS
jgi:hypothetical protein